MREPVYEVVWPLGRSSYETLRLAPRSPELNQATICELWDWLFRGGEVFPAIREAISARYPQAKFVDYTVFGNTRGANEREFIEFLPHLLSQHECDLAISGIGA